MLYPDDMQWYRPAYDRRGGSDYTATDKGQFMGSCNRSCCQAPGLATWWNQGSHSYYCFTCAKILNKANNFANELARLPLDQTQLCIPSSHPLHPNHAQIKDLDAQTDFDWWTMSYTTRAVRLFNCYHRDPAVFTDLLGGELTLAHFERTGRVVPRAVNTDIRPFTKPLDPLWVNKLPYNPKEYAQTLYKQALGSSI